MCHLLGLANTLKYGIPFNKQEEVIPMCQVAYTCTGHTKTLKVLRPSNGHRPAKVLRPTKETNMVLKRNACEKK